MSRSAMTVFLLSPAYCGGRRAGILLKAESPLPIARRLHEGTLTLGEAFAFMSGLYFRGKLAYAQAFARNVNAMLVITPTRGLLRTDTVVTADVLREFAEVDISVGGERYTRPLERDLTALAQSPDAPVVLLGSVATGKYVDILTRCLGDRLHYPTSFIGRGDMSRGGLLLRQAASGVELEYAVLHPGARRHGPRPPKLEPLDSRR